MPTRLSPRERQVLVSILKGQTATKQIAHELTISPRTVEIYRRNIRKKFGARTLIDVIRIVLSNDSKMTAIEGAKKQLEAGSLGEFIGLASVAIQSGQSKIKMDVDMAMALCLLADEALKRRRRR